MFQESKSAVKILEDAEERLSEEKLEEFLNALENLERSYATNFLDEDFEKTGDAVDCAVLAFQEGVKLALLAKQQGCDIYAASNYFDCIDRQFNFFTLAKDEEEFCQKIRDCLQSVEESDEEE